MRELVDRDLNLKSRGARLSCAVKHGLYFGFSMIALLISACFPVVDKQFITLSLILGAKWIVAGRTDKINILIK